MDFMGDIVSSAEYQFTNTLDLGAAFSDLARRFVTRAFFPNDTIDARTANVDTWNDFDGTGLMLLMPSYTCALRQMTHQDLRLIQHGVSS